MATHRLSTGDLEATFAPELAMLACSLRHRGEELLGQRSGVDEYARSGATMGIPLLHPWANRLGGFEYRGVTLRGGMPLDEHGLPIHGLLAAIRGWAVVEAGERRLAAELDGGALEGFPFPHVLRVEAELEDAKLTIATTLRATGDVAVPVSFGYHPYLRLPGVPRADWEVEVPVRERIEVDARGIPTGERTPVEPFRGRLGERTFDDGYVAGDAPFALAGGGRRIEVAFEQGYPYAQVFAPPADDVICFEPMTAPTDALRQGGAPAAHEYRARFSVTVL